MVTVEHHVGRLIEIRLAPPLQRADLDELYARNARLLEQLGRAVVCSDLRGVGLFPPELAERYLEGARASNARIERSAFLLPPRAVFTLQIQRIIKQAHNDARRAFTGVNALVAWLGEPLDDAERARLAAFLAG